MNKSPITVNLTIIPNNPFANYFLNIASFSLCINLIISIKVLNKETL